MANWMDPPWVLDPEPWNGERWILTKGEYLDNWRDWFCALSEAEQSSYRISHMPPLASKGFYDVFGRPEYDPARAAEKHRDSEGNLAPPWIAFPHIGLGSIGWRMGPGESYWHEFAKWYQTLQSTEKSAFRARYPEPLEVKEGYPWGGFYDRLEK